MGIDNLYKRIILPVILVVTMVCLCPGEGLSAEETVAALKERIIDIQNKGKLGFRNFNRCDNIITYGSYVPAEGNKVPAGSKLLFYYEPENVFTNRVGGSYQIWYTQDPEIPLGEFTKSIVNIGSVGQPRDDNPQAAYALYDDARKFATIRRVAYDVETAKQKIIDAGLPEVLAARLSLGR